jgi:3-oxoacyl-[acyl-carrier protein] reductase
VRQRASELAGTNNGDIVHLWTIVVADMSKPPLRGKVAIVTGGSRGIGLAIAQALVAEGAHVAITGRSESHLSTARPLIEAAGPGAVETLRADVRTYAEVERAIAATVARFGGLDILINNAGVGVFADVAAMTPEQWAEVIDTNLTGVFNACHAALPHLGRRNGGFIINISSLAGKNAFAGAAAYCASKSGLNAFSEALMQEVRHDNIRVSYVMPGSVATEFAGNDESRGADWKIAPEDVAEVVLNLLKHDTRSLPSRVELRPSRPKK